MAPDRIEGIDRHEAVFKLRVAGRTFSEIARELGYADESGPYRVILREWERRVRRPAEDLRHLELERMDALWRPLFDQFQSQVAAGKKISLGLVGQLIRLSEHRAKLTGLLKFAPPAPAEDEEAEAPVNQAPAEQLQSLLEKLRTRLAEQATPLEVIDHGPDGCNTGE